MAIDFLIFCLLLISFTINLLALGAFWVTPALRTTANRFVINLLIINLVGCMILAPTLFLNHENNNSLQFSTTANDFLTSSAASSSSPTGQTIDERIDIISGNGGHEIAYRHNGNLIQKEGFLIKVNRSDLNRNNNSDDNKNNNNNSSSNRSTTTDRTFETIFKCNSTFCHELKIEETSDTIIITEINEEHEKKKEDENDLKLTSTKSAEQLQLPPPQMRCWSIDLAAALGALAVLLVVGDTWCAVTDPLRYHSRISGLKTWLLIALTWTLGIFFGILSAFREIDFVATTTIMTNKQKRYIDHTEVFSMSTTGNIFGIIYACVYFIVIILLPFGFVCGMYWRIFSEARENGLRMRQNGSSPLLQSALNLAQQQQQQQQQQHQQQQQQQQHHHHHNNASHQLTPYSTNLYLQRNSFSDSAQGGLQMKIDNNRNSGDSSVSVSGGPFPQLPSLRRDSGTKVLLPPITDDLQFVAGDYVVRDDDEDDESNKDEMIADHQHRNHRNQNILLTLSTASGEIKRNYSARQLPLLGRSSQDLIQLNRLHGIRQVHSSPNLQKLNGDSLIESIPVHVPQHHGHHHHHHPHRHHQHPSGDLHHHVHHQALQIPAVASSPKALSYMTSIRHRLSNASSMFKYREESRAARISILVVIMFLVSYLPYGFLVLLQSRLIAANFTYSTQLSIVMIILANLTSPFIFAYRNKRVRSGVKRLFGFNASSCNSNNNTTASTKAPNTTSSNCCSGGFLRRSTGGGIKSASNINVRRSTSKVSTYSVNSCKFATTMQTNGKVPSAPALAHPPSSCLRINRSCSTIINNNLNNFSDSNKLIKDVTRNPGINNNISINNFNKNINNTNYSQLPLTGSFLISNHIINEKSFESNKQYSKTAAAKPTTTTTTKPQIAAINADHHHIHLPSKVAEKKSFFQIFCQNSKKLNCADLEAAAAAVAV